MVTRAQGRPQARGVLAHERSPGAVRCLSRSYERLADQSSQNTFFWTWKTGIDPRTGLVANPMWSYSLGLREGWIPRDPRLSDGFCARHFERMNVVQGRDQLTQYASRPIRSSLPDWSTGKLGESRLDLRAARKRYEWPPKNLSGLPTTGEGGLPRYERNRPLPRLEGLDRSKVGHWKLMGPKQGCKYPDPFDQDEEQSSDSMLC